MEVPLVRNTAAEEEGTSLPGVGVAILNLLLIAAGPFSALNPFRIYLAETSSREKEEEERKCFSGKFASCDTPCKIQCKRGAAAYRTDPNRRS